MENGKHEVNKLKMTTPVGLPPPPELPRAPTMSKEEKMKEYEKSQQKVLEDMIKKRQSKVIAYRKSRAPGIHGNKGEFEEIGFLKGLK